MCTHTHTHARTHTHTSTHKRKPTHTGSAFVRQTQTHSHTHTHTHSHTFRHVHTYIHTRTHTRRQSDEGPHAHCNGVIRPRTGHHISAFILCDARAIRNVTTSLVVAAFTLQNINQLLDTSIMFVIQSKKSHSCDHTVHNYIS